MVDWEQSPDAGLPACLRNGLHTKSSGGRCLPFFPKQQLLSSTELSRATNRSNTKQTTRTQRSLSMDLLKNNHKTYQNLPVFFPTSSPQSPAFAFALAFALAFASAFASAFALGFALGSVSRFESSLSGGRSAASACDAWLC